MNKLIKPLVVVGVLALVKYVSSKISYTSEIEYPDYIKFLKKKIPELTNEDLTKIVTSVGMYKAQANNSNNTNIKILLSKVTKMKYTNAVKFAPHRIDFYIGSNCFFNLFF